MNDIYITLAVEDQLSETVVRKLLDQVGRNYQVSLCLGKRGYGYLKSKIKGFNQAAKGGICFFVLTDQDKSSECPPQKIKKWLGQAPNQNLIFESCRNGSGILGNGPSGGIRQISFRSPE